MFKLNPGLAFFIGGPGTGKTELCLNLLNNLQESFSVVPQHIYFYYEHWQNAYNRLPSNTHLLKGIPDSFPDKERQIIVLDDIGDMLMASLDLYRLASVHARHSETYVICIKHNIFSSERYSKDLSLAASYYALFENFRYSTQIMSLAKQLMPGKTRYFMDSYRKAVNAYGYLLVDLQPRRENRLLSDILADRPAIYVPL